MKNLSTVKSVRRKSALWCVVCDVRITPRFSHLLHDCLPVYFNPNYLDMHSPCGHGGTVFSNWAWAEVTILEFPKAYIFSFSILLKVCNISSCMWWSWSFWNGEVIVQVGDVVQPCPQYWSYNCHPGPHISPFTNSSESMYSLLLFVNTFSEGNKI